VIGSSEHFKVSCIAWEPTALRWLRVSSTCFSYLILRKLLHTCVQVLTKKWKCSKELCASQFLTCAAMRGSVLADGWSPHDRQHFAVASANHNRTESVVCFRRRFAVARAIGADLQYGKSFKLSIYFVQIILQMETVL